MIESHSIAPHCWVLMNLSVWTCINDVWLTMTICCCLNSYLRGSIPFLPPLWYVLIHHFILDLDFVHYNLRCNFAKKGCTLHQRTISRALTPSKYCVWHTHSQSQRHTSSLKCFWFGSLWNVYCWNAAHLYIKLSLNTWYQYQNRNLNSTWMSVHVWFATFIIWHSEFCLFCRHSLIWIIKIVITLLHISIWWWIMNGNG